jgi:hypothetical protein
MDAVLPPDIAQVCEQASSEPERCAEPESAPQPRLMLRPPLTSRGILFPHPLEQEIAGEREPRPRPAGQELQPDAPDRWLLVRRGDDT